MIYLMRHGETARRFHGRLDSPLTEKGLAQADQLGILLSREIGGRDGQFRGYVSPIGRARETARRIAQFVSVTFIDEPRLMEVSVGSWDGLTLQEIGLQHPGALNGSDMFDWFFRSPDGESFDQACNRIASWLAETSTPVVAISHGLTTRLLRGLYLGLSRREMLELPVPQNGLYRLDSGKIDFIAAA